MRRRRFSRHITFYQQLQGGGLTEGHLHNGSQSFLSVGDLVEDDEARIHGIAACPEGHIDGVSVAADVVVGFEQDNTVVLIQQGSGTKPEMPPPMIAMRMGNPPLCFANPLTVP